MYVYVYVPGTVCDHRACASLGLRISTETVLELVAMYVYVPGTVCDHRACFSLGLGSGTDSVLELVGGNNGLMR